MTPGLIDYGRFFRHMCERDYNKEHKIKDSELVRPDIVNCEPIYNK